MTTKASGATKEKSLQKAQDEGLRHEKGVGLHSIAFRSGDTIESPETKNKKQKTGHTNPDD